MKTMGAAILELVWFIFFLGTGTGVAFNMKITRPASQEDEQASNARAGEVLGILKLPRDDQYIKNKPEVSYKSSLHAEIERFTEQLLQTISKYSHHASSQDELIPDGDVDQGGEEVNTIRKRSQSFETHGGGCTATPTWIPLGANIFPRFIRSYTCSSVTCQSGGTCRGKEYTVYVLQKLSPENRPVAAEDCPTSLPLDIRCNYKLVQRNITSYCECRAN